MEQTSNKAETGSIDSLPDLSGILQVSRELNTSLIRQAESGIRDRSLSLSLLVNACTSHIVNQSTLHAVASLCHFKAVSDRIRHPISSPQPPALPINPNRCTMAGDDKKLDDLSDIPHERNEPRPDFSKPLPPAKLPKPIQETLDNEAKLWDTLYEGKAGDSTDNDVRYAAYAARIRTIMLSAQRYVAYTSDIGESFRPIAHPGLVRGAYAISWAYLIGDVTHEGYKAYIRNQRTLGAPPADSTEAHDDKGGQLAATAVAATKDLVKPAKVAAIDDYRVVMAQRAVFQSIASMGLPAFTIHSIVRYSGRALKSAKNQTIRTWGPIGLGLAAVPFLPYVFDKPVEHVVETVFHKGFEMVGGKEAVGHEKEKEL